MLIDSGLELETRNTTGMTPLDVAAVTGNLEIAYMLIVAGADVHHKGCTTLHHAARGGSERMVDLLLDNGASLTATHEGGVTVLHEAIANGHEDLVEILIEEGASVHAADGYGTSVLHAASDYGHIEMVEMLIEKGASPATADQFGTTALHRAAIHGHEWVTRALVESGAPLDAKDQNGDTPFMIAVSNYHPDADNASSIVKCGRTLLRAMAHQAIVPPTAVLADIVLLWELQAHPGSVDRDLEAEDQRKFEEASQKFLGPVLNPGVFGGGGGGGGWRRRGGGGGGFFLR